jgi:hypothetical protein
VPNGVLNTIGLAEDAEMREISCKDIATELGIRPQSVTKAVEPALDKIARLYRRWPQITQEMILQRARQLGQVDVKRELSMQIGASEN